MLIRENVKALSHLDQYLSLKNVYAICSEVKGISMAYWNDHLVIFTLNSDLAIESEEIPELTKWLRQIHQNKYLPLNMPITFGVKKSKITISYGCNGRIEIFRDRIQGLAEELDGIYEDLSDRKRMQLKGA